MSRDITLASAVVLRGADGRVLLVKENYGRLRWGLPGGAPAVQPGGEIAEIGWFSPGDLPDPMTHTAPHGIRDAVAGSRGAFREIDA
jgi:hypothetical protein